MRVGMVGLGKMGGNMALRLVRAGHEVVGFDLDPAAVSAAADAGVGPSGSLAELAAALEPPRAVWMMVPAGPAVDATIGGLLAHLAPGDVVVDGGNSYYKDTRRRSHACHEAGIQLVDAGTSGGVWGLTDGYSLMVGGDEEAVERLRPVFAALAPGPETGWGRVGPTGAGHFVKMVHNGIEYGLMQAYAEGFAVLRAKDELDLDLHAIAEIWRFGSVVRSWLLDIISDVLAADASLADVAPYVPDSGEGRWTVFEAIDLDVPTPVIALALMRRLTSRDEVAYADRLLSAMRGGFGGHAIRKTGEAL